MTTTSLRIAVLLTAALALAGCATPGSGTAEPTPTSTADPSAPPSETATPSPSPTRSAQQTCDEIVTPELATKLETDGLVEQESFYVFPFEQRLIDAGGTVCAWGRPQSEIALSLVRLATAGDAEQEWADELAADGYTRTDDPVPGTYTGEVDAGSGLPTVVVVEPGGLTFVSTPFFADQLTPVP